MLPDSECLKVVSEILDQLFTAQSYVIRVNHKLVLDGILNVCGVPSEMLQTICSSIDKYDGVNTHKTHQQIKTMHPHFSSFLFNFFLFCLGLLANFRKIGVKCMKK